jgi:hypothetical protein
MKCVICDGEIEVLANGYALGHNAEPVRSGGCCTECNDAVVIPMRLRRLHLKPLPPGELEKIIKGEG